MVRYMVKTTTYEYYFLALPPSLPPSFLPFSYPPALPLLHMRVKKQAPCPGNRLLHPSLPPFLVLRQEHAVPEAEEG